MGKWYEYLDFMGRKPQLYYNGKYSHHSLIGAYFLSLFFNRTSFTVYNNEDRIISSSTKRFNNDFSVIVLDRVFKEIPDIDRLLEIVGEQWTDETIHFDNDTIVSETIRNIIPMEKCNIGNWPNYNVWRQEKFLNSSICFSSGMNNLTIKGNFAAKGYSGIVLWFRFCENDTDRNISNCYPIEVIKERLDNVFVSVKFLSYYFDHESIYNYSIPYIYSDIRQASTSSYSRQWYQFQAIEYTSDNGMIFSMNERSEYSIMKNTYNSFDLRKNSTLKNTFFTISLNMTDKASLIKRSYYKLQNFIADFSGIIRVILGIAEGLYLFYGDYLYYKGIIASKLKEMTQSTSINIKKTFTFQKTKNTDSFLDLLYNVDYDNSIAPNDKTNKNTHEQSKHHFNTDNFNKSNTNLNSILPDNYITPITKSNNKKPSSSKHNLINATQLKWYNALFNPLIYFTPSHYHNHPNKSLRIHCRFVSLITRQLDLNSLLKTIDLCDHFKDYLKEDRNYHFSTSILKNNYLSNNSNIYNNFYHNNNKDNVEQLNNFPGSKNNKQRNFKRNNESQEINNGENDQ